MMIKFEWVLLVLVTLAFGGKSIDITCTTREGSGVVGDGVTSSVECSSGETLVSCGVKGTQNLGGARINQNKCEILSHDNNAAWPTYPEAVCCTFPTGSISSVTDEESAAGTSVSSTCPANSVLTGCHVYYASGNKNEIRGSYTGDQEFGGPQTSLWISTGNKCLAQSRVSSTTVTAQARCIQLTGYSLNCQTKATYTNYNNFGECPSGFDMFGCNTFTLSATLDSYYRDAGGKCYVQQDNHAEQYANAICCQLSDIDECSTGNHNCDENASCTNSVGGFQCQCNAGYTGDGETCSDIDECSTGSANCDPNASCSNTIGGFQCECNVGYTGDGQTCTDIDECAEGESNECINGDCINTVGGYTCDCNAGYEPNQSGTSCIDIDECNNNVLANICGARTNCVNTNGGYECRGDCRDVLISCSDNETRQCVKRGSYLKCQCIQNSIPIISNYPFIILCIVYIFTVVVFVYFVFCGKKNKRKGGYKKIYVNSDQFSEIESEAKPINI